VGIVAHSDAPKVRALLDKHHIAFDGFDDIDSTSFAVAEPYADRARKLIREDSWNHGYELLKHMKAVPEAGAINKVGFVVFNADQAEVLACLTSVGIKNPFAINLDSGGVMPFEVVVDVADTAKARTALKADSIKHHYYFKDSDESFVRNEGVQRTIITPPAPEKKPETLAQPVTHDTKLVTVVAVADKDSKVVLAGLRASRINAPGTWKSNGITGIVVAASDAAAALKVIQEDARKHGYRLLSTTAREPKPMDADWSGTPPSKEDMAAEADLIVFVREKFEPFVSNCLEARGISSGASCSLNSCGIYVSKLDADRALALLHQDALEHGYTFTSQRVH
jgi:hypothetical protein